MPRLRRRTRRSFKRRSYRGRRKFGRRRYRVYRRRYSRRRNSNSSRYKIQSATFGAWSTLGQTATVQQFLCDIALNDWTGFPSYSTAYQYFAITYVKFEFKPLYQRPLISTTSTAQAPQPVAYGSARYNNVLDTPNTANEAYTTPGTKFKTQFEPFTIKGRPYINSGVYGGVNTTSGAGTYLNVTSSPTRKVTWLPFDTGSSTEEAAAYGLQHQLGWVLLPPSSTFLQSWTVKWKVWIKLKGLNIST